MTLRAWASRLWRRRVRRPLGTLLHPWRHAAALKRVARAENVHSLLFICHGNICRSPYAAQALLRKLPPELSARLRIDSAGFLGPGRPPPAPAVWVAARRGVDIAGHRSSLVDAGRVHVADFVIVMDASQQQEIAYRYGKALGRVLILADLLDRFREARLIPDPVEQPAEVFEQVYSQIDEALGTLVSALMPGGHSQGRGRP